MGLSGNPFRVASQEEIARTHVAAVPDSGVSPEEIASAAEAVIQITAPRGWGKSTLLHAVRDRLDALGRTSHYFYCPPDRRFAFRPPRIVDALLIDEAQRLGRRGLRSVRNWQRLTNGRVVLTTHEDLRDRLALPTRAIELPPADAEMIRRFFAKRIEWSGGDPARVRLAEGAAEWLADVAEGALRRVEEICYEALQRVEPGAQVVVDVPLLEHCAELRFGVIRETTQRVLPVTASLR